LIKFGTVYSDELRKGKLAGAMPGRHPLYLPLVPECYCHTTDLGISNIDQVKTTEHGINLGIDFRGSFKDLFYPRMRTTNLRIIPCVVRIAMEISFISRVPAVSETVENKKNPGRTSVCCRTGVKLAPG